MNLTKKGWAFLALAYGIAWGLCGIAWVAGVRAGSPLFLAFASVVMLAPLASALIVSAARPSGRPLREVLAIRFRMGWRGCLLAWLVFPAVAILALGLALLLPGVSYDPTMSQVLERLTRGLSPEKIEEVRRIAAASPAPSLAITLLQGLAAGLTINALFAFGEEAGWRGFLVRELSGSTFLSASLFTGAVWGLWHAPLILQGHNYPEHPVLGVFLMTAFCFLVSPIFLYIRLKTRSTIAAAIAHGTMNGTAGLAILPLAGGSDLSIGMTGLVGFIALAVLLGILYLVDRRSERPLMSSRIGRDD